MNSFFSLILRSWSHPSGEDLWNLKGNYIVALFSPPPAYYSTQSYKKSSSWCPCKTTVPCRPTKKKKKKNIASTISFLFGLTEAYLKKCFHVTPEPHVLHQACPVPPLKYTLCHKPYRLNHLLYFFSKEHNRKRCESPLGAAKYKTGWDILKLSLKADWGKHMDYSRC